MIITIVLDPKVVWYVSVSCDFAYPILDCIYRANQAARTAAITRMLQHYGVLKG